MIKKYTRLQDFVMDPSFNEWVSKADLEAEAYWRAWLQANPDKSELVRQARILVLNLQEDTEKLKEQEKAIMWANIQGRKNQTILAGNHFEDTARDDSGVNWKFFLSVAASVAFVIVFSAVFFISRTPSSGNLVYHKTQFGEIKNIDLPDGSTLVLNANSQVSFHESFNMQEVREVTLKGEAFFSVRHKSDEQKFKVKIADNIDVEVLGTQFTVTSRPEKTRVVLNEGKVKLTVTEEALMGLSHSNKLEEVLESGELIELGSKYEIAVKKDVLNPEVFSAFQHHKIAFIDASLFEVARVLKDTYGYEVNFSENSIGNRRFTGTVPSDRVDLLLATLEKLFNLQVVKQDRRINIS